MRLRYWSNALVAITVALSISAYTVAERFPALALIAVPGALLGWYLADVRAVAITRRPVSDILVLVAIAWSAFRVRSVGWAQGLTVSVFCEFLIAIIVVKMWDRKLPRDTAQILILSSFLSVGSMLTGASLGMAAVLLANLLTLVPATMLFHIAAGPDGPGQGTAPGRPAGRPTLPRVRGHFAFTTAFALAAGLAISLVVFLVMPRGIGSGLAGTFGQTSGGRQTGLADHVDLMQSGLISESSRTVLRARFTDLEGNSIGADGRVFYLRARALDNYDGRTWTGNSARAESMLKQDAPPMERVQVRRQIDPGPDGVVQFIEMLAVPRYAPLPHVYSPLEVWADRESTFKSYRPARTLSREGDPGLLRYTVTSGPPPFPADDLPPSGNQANFPVVRVRDITERLLRDAGIDPDSTRRPRSDDHKACSEIERYLRSNFAYTLDTPSVAPNTDPIVFFLTQSRAGHCEFFASAMAGMCRSVGINARVIAGYAAGEFDHSTQTYTVRESNAHAWVEAEIADRVWWTYDPTPPDTLRARLQPPRGLAAAWLTLLDKLNTRWSDSFVLFDESSRRRLIGFEADPEPWLREKLASLRVHFNEEGWRGATPIILKAAAWTVGACIVAVALLRLSRAALFRAVAALRRRAALRADPGLARAMENTEFFRRAMNALRSRGFVRPAWQPPLAFSATVATHDAALGEAAKLASDLYYRARFGRHAPTDEELRAVNRALDEAARF